MGEKILRKLYSRHSAWNWTLHWSSGCDPLDCDASFLQCISDALQRGSVTTDRESVQQYASYWSGQLLNGEEELSDQCLNFLLDLWFGGICESSSSSSSCRAVAPSVDCWDCTFVATYLLPMFSRYERAFFSPQQGSSGGGGDWRSRVLASTAFGEASRLLDCDVGDENSKSPWCNHRQHPGFAALAKKERALRRRAGQTQRYLQSRSEIRAPAGHDSPPCLLVVPVITKGHFFLYVYDLDENCIEYYDSKLDHLASKEGSASTLGTLDAYFAKSKKRGWDEKRAALQAACDGFETCSVEACTENVAGIETYHSALYWFILAYIGPPAPPRFLVGSVHPGQQQRTGVDCGFFTLATAMLRCCPPLSTPACRSLRQEHMPGYRQFLVDLLDTALVGVADRLFSPTTTTK
jgi:hypothetical protein